METQQTSTNDSFKNSSFAISHPNSDKYIETAPNVKLYVKDYGKGKPVILIHGWPLSNEMWEYQMEALIQNNFRVIVYDRRGFGKSSQPYDGYDYDTLTNDLKSIIDQLELKEVTLVGFSMGGGEVVRYFSKFKGENVSKAVLVSSVTPFRLKTADNPGGKSEEENADTAKAINNDRLGFLDVFGKNFFGKSLLNDPISDPLLEYYRMLCSFASPKATLECAKSFSITDFRDEMYTVNVPTLIIHGDNDKIVDIEISSKKSAALIPNNQFIIYEDAPHGLFYTHKDKLNSDLVKFLNS
jgi:non-heme chloroperoxidase